MSQQIVLCAMLCVLCMLCLPAGVPRLFDLVRVREERVKLAFYFALRDTVVADSLDQASRIAYGKDRRWGRVVTTKVPALLCRSGCSHHKGVGLDVTQSS